METDNLANIADELFSLVIGLNRKVMNPDAIMRDLPMTPSQFKIIFYLIHCGSQPVSQIGKHLGISKSNMTPLIDRLIDQGYVHRYEDPTDRRIIRVEITEKAKDFFKNQRQKVKGMLVDKLSTLSEDDLILLQQSIKNISNILVNLYIM